VSWSLRARLTLSYVLVALLGVLTVSALANGVLEGSFRRYLRGSQQKRAQAVAAQLGSQMRADGSWDQQGLAAVGMAALEQGLLVRLISPGGKVVWDVTVHNSGLCAQMITHLAANMSSRYPNWRGDYAENLYPVRTDFREVGTAVIGHYGPFFLNDQDLTFINSLNRLLIWSALAALASAVVLGLWMARRITVPLARVAAATQKIAGGSRDVRIAERTRVRELDGIAEAVNDLTQALGRQEAQRRRLTADMAHELRTPLAALQSHLEALLDGVWQPDRARLSGLHEEVLRISRLVSDLEYLARCERDALALRRTATNASAVVEGVVRNHQAQFHAKGVELSFVVEAGSERPVLPLDADKLSQAVINLLSNALKFTPAGGRVQVRVGSPADSSGVEIRVADTGIGIDPQDLPRVFDRLYRADSSRSRATGGAGIGLAIAKAIVEAHGGTITAESAPGSGSEFRIRLPG
jgi:two-component system sensor histidine kinase BaeS